MRVAIEQNKLEILRELLKISIQSGELNLTGERIVKQILANETL